MGSGSEKLRQAGDGVAVSEMGVAGAEVDGAGGAALTLEAAAVVGLGWGLHVETVDGETCEAGPALVDLGVLGKARIVGLDHDRVPAGLGRCTGDAEGRAETSVPGFRILRFWGRRNILNS